MRTIRRTRSCASACALITLAAALALPAPAAAQGAYPNRPIRFIVPYPPGGNTDVFARLVGMRLAERWGQQVVMDNRPGAAGTLGAEIAARAAPDGYTLVVGTFGNMIVGRSLYPKLRYDPLQDFAPVSLIAKPAGVLSVNPSVPSTTLREFIGHVKANPGKLSYGSPGTGAWNHLFFELLKQRAGIDIVHIPYKGIAIAATDVIGGQIHAMIAAFPTSTPHVKTGKLRALAVTGAARSPLLPDTPTVSEAGLPGYQATGWFAVLAPKGVPAPILARLNAETVRALETPELRAALALEGADPAPTTSDALARSMREQVELWAGLIRTLGVALQ